MKQLITIGRSFYGFGIAAFGVQQLVIKDFRPEILPPFPAPAHTYTVFPILTGIALLFAGIIISGLFITKRLFAKAICLYLGFFFLVLVIICHLPYTLIFSPNKASHLVVWDAALEELAYCGGAFVMARSFSENKSMEVKKNLFQSLLEKLIPAGRIFFSTLIIVYGCSHFVYIDYVSAMVPKWLGMPVFWTYFGGAALIGAGVAIVFKIWIKPIAFLLALMIFLWILFIHLPAAIAHPFTSHGDNIIEVFDALLFCGIALVIAITNSTKQEVRRTI